jgi:hypothetical protein
MMKISRRKLLRPKASIPILPLFQEIYFHRWVRSTKKNGHLSDSPTPFAHKCPNFSSDLQPSSNMQTTSSRWINNSVVQRMSLKNELMVVLENFLSKKTNICIAWQRCANITNQLSSGFGSYARISETLLGTITKTTDQEILPKVTAGNIESLTTKSKEQIARISLESFTAKSNMKAQEFRK